jgi:hypothetical protein
VPSKVDGPELNAPEANRLKADNDAPFSQKILNISVTEIEAMV